MSVVTEYCLAQLPTQLHLPTSTPGSRLERRSPDASVAPLAQVYRDGHLQRAQLQAAGRPTSRNAPFELVTFLLLDARRGPPLP